MSARNQKHNSSTTLDSKIQSIFNDWCCAQKQELESEINSDKHSVIKKLSKELNYVLLTKCEHETLVENATKSKQKIDKDLKTKVEEQVELLQREMNYQLEKKDLVHNIELTKLKEEIKYLKLMSNQPSVNKITEKINDI